MVPQAGVPAVSGLGGFAFAWDPGQRGTRHQLRAQAHHAEIRQGDPLTQTDHGMGVESLQWERPKNLPAF